MSNDSSSSQATARDAPLKLLACSGSLDGGGSERQLWQLVSRLDRARWTPEVYLLNKRGPYLKQLPSDVPVFSFDEQHPTPASFPPGRISTLQRGHLRRLVQSRRIDVVYDRTFHMSLLTGWALPVTQPRVSVIVSPPSRDLPASEKRFLRIKRWLLARAYRTATATVCVSEEVADDAARYYGLSRSALVVMPNPVDIAAVRELAGASEAPGVLGSRSDDGLRVAVVGRFTSEKGHHLAIDALREFRAQPANRDRSLHLHFVGDGPLKAQIESLVAASSLSGYVHFHGYQTNPYPLWLLAMLCWCPAVTRDSPTLLWKPWHWVCRC